MFTGIEADGIVIDPKHIELFDALPFLPLTKISVHTREPQRVRVLIMIDQPELNVVVPDVVATKSKKLWELGGFLKDSTFSKKHVLDIQKEMRDEWD